MRLIDANKLKDVIHQHQYMLATITGSKDNGMFTLGIDQAIDEQSTVDAEPVRHGHWEVATGYDPQRKFQCSECGRMAFENSKYCPNCGARIDEEEAE